MSIEMIFKAVQTNEAPFYRAKWEWLAVWAQTKRYTCTRCRVLGGKWGSAVSTEIANIGARGVEYCGVCRLAISTRSARYVCARVWGCRGNASSVECWGEWGSAVLTKLARYMYERSRLVWGDVSSAKWWGDWVAISTRKARYAEQFFRHACWSHHSSLTTVTWEIALFAIQLLLLPVRVENKSVFYSTLWELNGLPGFLLGVKCKASHGHESVRNYVNFNPSNQVEVLLRRAVRLVQTLEWTRKIKSHSSFSLF